MTEDEQLKAMLEKSKLTISNPEFENLLLARLKKLSHRQKKEKIIFFIAGQVCMLVSVGFLVYRLALPWIKSFSKESSISNVVDKLLTMPFWTTFDFYLLPLIVFIISGYMAAIRKSAAV